jgi:aminoglycoside/choline kinase family phosphotransferase
MVVRNKIRVIDFQDAFMAPYCYDLACFMYDRDTSQILGEDLIAETVKYNFNTLSEAGFRPLDFAGYMRVFNLCVLHRAFKVVGRFYYLAVFKKKPEYLDFMPSEYDVLGKFLDRCPEFIPLKKMLQKHLPELK